MSASRENTDCVALKQEKSEGWLIRTGQLQRPGGSHLGRGFLALVDVAVDEVQVLGHLGVHARVTRESTTETTPVTHDAHLDEATGSMAHQRPAIIPLYKHKTCTCTLGVSLSELLTLQKMDVFIAFH